jgi:RNA polymerase sigma-70 factor (ECF subfamily)
LEPGILESGIRNEVLRLVRARVRVRFAPTEDEFVAHVIERAHAAGSGGDMMAYVRSLNLDDLYLARSCSVRDDRAWAECGRVHFGFMREFARRFLSAADAAELTDQVIADLWEKEKLARYEGRSTLRTWLGAVVAHAALQAGKVARRREADVERSRRQAFVAANDPEDQQSAGLLARITAEAIEALPADQKLLLLLHYEQDLSLDQIAPILGTSKATLSRRLKRIREDLRAAIERVARDRYRSSGQQVRGTLDLGRIDMDLSALLSGIRSVKGSGGDGV